jgi:hypothetical protein
VQAQQDLRRADSSQGKPLLHRAASTGNALLDHVAAPAARDLKILSAELKAELKSELQPVLASYFDQKMLELESGVNQRVHTRVQKVVHDSMSDLHKQVEELVSNAMFELGPEVFERIGRQEAMQQAQLQQPVCDAVHFHAVAWRSRVA